MTLRSTAFDPEAVAARLAEVRTRIASAGGDPQSVEVLAVTKGLPVDAVNAARAAGLFDVGENYAQELAAKYDEYVGLHAGRPAERGGDLRWHMIGRLQRNKVRLLAGRVHCWQSVDRLELGREIARHDPRARIMAQVNATGEPNKGGFDPAEVADAVAQFTDLGLRVLGLMTVGPTDPGLDPRPGFEATAALAQRLGLAQCSMGMSGDLEAAVSCGSTMVRVGTALFGPRPPRVTKSGT